MTESMLALVTTKAHHNYHGEIRGGTITVAGHSFPAQKVRRLEVLWDKREGFVDLEDGTRLLIPLGVFFTTKRAFSGSVDIYVDGLSKILTLSAREICLLTRDAAERAG